MKTAIPPRLHGDHPAQLRYLTRPLATGCWEFTGYITPDGYGQLGRNRPAHRVAWEVATGRAVPDGLVIDHLCRNRVCVNPAHLEPVTNGVNVMRGVGVSPTNAAKTHCGRGHEFTHENTYYRPDRYGRICIACRDAALAKLRPYYKAKRQAARRAAA